MSRRACDGLREFHKKAYHDFLDYQAKQTPVRFIDFRYPKRQFNMRQAYVYAKKLQSIGGQATDQYRKVLADLVDTGDIFHYAVKYGREAAMLWKLNSGSDD